MTCWRDGKGGVLGEHPARAVCRMSRVGVDHDVRDLPENSLPGVSP